MDINKNPLKLIIVDDNNKKPLKLIIVDDHDKKPLKLIIVDDHDKKPLKLIIVDDDNKKPLKLIIVDDKNSLKSNVDNLSINQYPSDHMCYVLKSLTSKRIYVGYTIDFNRRLRQHNGEIVGGAKKTGKGRPWLPICQIKGFLEKSSALRFEWRIQHSKKPRPNCISNISIILKNLINQGDGLLAWPKLTIEWI